MLRIADSLADAGHQISMVGVHRGRTLDASVRHKIHRFTCIFRRGILFYIEYNIRLVLFLLRADFDLIYTVDLDTILAGSLVKRWRAKKQVFDSHEFFSEVPELEGRRLKKWLWTQLGHWTIPYTDIRWTVSTSLAKALETKYGFAFGLLRNMPKRYREVPMRNAEIKNLVYLGVLNKGRGLEQCIRVLAARKELSLTLIGDGDLRQELEDLADQLKVSDRLIFAGRLPRDQIFDTLTGYDLGLNILESQSKSYRLSLANKYFDYIQAELPSIQIAFEEYVRMQEKFACCYLVHQATEQDIGDAITALQKNDNLDYDRMVEECRKAKQMWHWDVEKEQLIGQINKLYTPI